MDGDSSNIFIPLNQNFKLPENPRDLYYFTNCFVCSAKSKPGSEFVNNYGAIVCFGCRAFWRRIHTSGMVSKLQCTLESSCNLTGEPKSRCKSCRYLRCKVAGMLSEKIMTDEQKMKRFRNFGQTKTSKSSEQHENIPTIQSMEFMTFKVSNLDDFSRHQNDPNEIKTENPDSQTFDSKGNPTSRLYDVLTNRIKFSHLCYMETIGQNEIFKTWLPSSKDEFWSHIASITDEFQLFAEKHEVFNRLLNESKSFLLLKNTQLFLQFYLACNLAAFSPNQPQISYLEKLESLLSMFRPNSDVDHYANLIHQVTDFVERTTPETYGMLAFTILLNIFNDIPSSCSEDRSTLEEQHVVNETFFLRFIQDHNKGLKCFLDTLKQMSNFFDANF